MYTFITAFIASDGRILCSIMFTQDKLTPYLDFLDILPDSPGAWLLPCVRVPQYANDAYNLSSRYSGEVARALEDVRQYNRPGDADYLEAAELQWRVYVTLQGSCFPCPWNDASGDKCRRCGYSVSRYNGVRD